MRNRLVIGNWKMNGDGSGLQELDRFTGLAKDASCTVVVCPPSILLHRMTSALSGTQVRTGGQDCHAAASGAHTGDVSAPMLVEAGATYCIVGHSERRTDLGESCELVQAKAEAAIRAGLTAILCIGETESERRKSRTEAVLSAQIDRGIPKTADSDNLIVAYEPVWAIGTGLTASLEQIAEAHRFIRQRCAQALGVSAAERLSIVYGGSVKPGNAGEIFNIGNVDGGLIGGASLNGDDFAEIIRQYV